MSSTLPNKPTTLFEASWEVCNKVGGIHTVLTTKLSSAQKAFSRYYCVGPWLAENPAFHEEPIPQDFAAAVEKVASMGVGVHYGHWLTDGEPTTFLIDWQGLIPQLNGLKQQYWENFQLDSLHTDFYDIDQPLMWSSAAGMLVSAFAETQKEPILFHGHEWLSAGAFLQLHKNEKVRSVFTTHATVLGRALSSDGSDLYGKLLTINPEEEARNHGVITKHQLEKLGATTATVFTTVSSLTGREAAKLLGKQPDFITENGVDPELFPPFDALCLQHGEMREVLHNFMSSYFFPSYQFDLNKTSYTFTMGRYEMHNKGYDVYLEALGSLNKELKDAKDPQTVVGCIFVPGDAVGIRADVQLYQTAQHHIRNLLANYSSLQQRELYQNLWNQQEDTSSPSQLLPAHVLDQIKQLLLRLPRYENVPISPFNLRHPESDSILLAAEKFGLTNSAEDRVKVLFFPAYFDGFDGVFNRNIYDLVSGCDLGVFPSYYEPWGYTPMESLALGVPAITSNLAGFGLAVEEHAPNQKQWVLEREGISNSEAAGALMLKIVQFIKSTQRQQLQKRMEAYQAVESFSWTILYKKYKEAYYHASQTPA